MATDKKYMKEYLKKWQKEHKQFHGYFDKKLLEIISEYSFKMKLTKTRFIELAILEKIKRLSSSAS